MGMTKKSCCLWTVMGFAVFVLLFMLSAQPSAAADKGGVYYDTLTATEKYVYNTEYDETANGKIRYDGSLSKPGNIVKYSFDTESYNISKDEYNVATNAFYFDHPEFFWLVRGAYSYYYSGEVHQGFMYSYFSNADLATAKARVDSAETKLMTGVTGSDFEKVKAIHDNIINNSIYELYGEQQSLYGLAVEGHGVCAGYASLFSDLAHKAGLDATVIVNSEHVWNRVKVAGQWYDVDTTFDDTAANSIDTGGTSYGCFLLSTTNMSSFLFHELTSQSPFSQAPTSPADYEGIAGMRENHKVTYEVAYGYSTSNHSLSPVTYGSKLLAPSGITPAGYIISGWYKDSAYTQPWDFLQEAVTADVTVYGKTEKVAAGSYGVTFETNGGTAVPAQAVSENGQVTKPAAPTREGYDFAGWYQDESCTKSWDFASKITGETRIYAKWNKKNLVCFVTDGDSVAPQFVSAGKRVTEPDAAAIKAGCTLAGWYKDSGHTEKWDFNTDTMPDKSLVLYARWTKNAFDVIYDSQGGSPEKVTKVTTYQGKYSVPDNDPGKAGYSFEGWYTEPNGGDKITDADYFDNAGSQVLYAHWKAKRTTTGNKGTLTISGIPTYRYYNGKLVNVTWNKVAGARGYVIYVCQYKGKFKSSCKFTRISMVAGNISSTKCVVKAGTKCKFRVKAYKIADSKAVLGKYRNAKFSYIKKAAEGMFENIRGYKSYKIQMRSYSTKRHKWSKWGTVMTSGQTATGQLSYINTRVATGCRYSFRILGKSQNGSATRYTVIKCKQR
jgi:uncharacterized repeat protein (TIGR02543 family)